MKANSISLMVLPLLLAACDAPSDGPSGPAGVLVPEGYSHFLVYYADGTWDPADPSVDPVTPETLQRDVWGFSDAQIQQFEADAKAFFVRRFGVDVDDPALAGRLHVAFSLADPRAGYRVVAMGGREVPAEGWPVWDGAWVATVIDPDGLELGGEFAGVTAPLTASMTFGRYQIDTGDEQDLAISFSSLTPFTTDPFGNSSVRCELHSEELGSGEATAMFALSQSADGKFTLQASNVLVFP